MKPVLSNFKSTQAEAQRWRAALAEDGQTLSDVCRKALNRVANRVEKAKRHGVKEATE
jgi:DNA-binding protein YbaB